MINPVIQVRSIQAHLAIFLGGVLLCVSATSGWAQSPPKVSSPLAGRHIHTTGSQTVVFAPAPEIATVNVSVQSGSTLRLVALAGGSAPRTFRWYRNDALLPDAVNSSLEFVSISGRNSGRYVVEISNHAGSVLSAVMHVTVQSTAGVVRRAPEIIGQPVSHTIVPGGAVTLSVSASGTPPLSYQWYKDGAAIPGAQGDSLQFEGVAAEDSGVYSAQVRNSAGSELSEPARLTVTALDTSSAVVLRWNRSADPDVAGYYVYATSSALGGTTRIAAGRNVVTLTGLVPGASYSFRVTSYNSAGMESKPSSLLARRMPATAKHGVPNPSTRPKISNIVDIAEGGGPSSGGGQTGGQPDAGTELPVALTTEILFQDDEGFLAVWNMRGREMVASDYLAPNRLETDGSRVLGRADFDGDGHKDLLILTGDRHLEIWFMNGTTMSWTALLNIPPVPAEWEVSVIADLNQDGQSDLILQRTTGELAVWYLDGLSVASEQPLLQSYPRDSTARLVAVGSFGPERPMGLVFQDAQGDIAVWSMDRDQLLDISFLNPSGPGSARWRVRATSDLDRDGTSDLLLQDTETGTAAVWLMDQLNLRDWAYLRPAVPGGTWKIAP